MLIKLGINAKSLLNWQVPILTEGDHTNARIVNMNVDKIENYLNEGIAIIPGFQEYLKTVISQLLEEEVQMQLLCQ